MNSKKKGWQAVIFFSAFFKYLIYVCMKNWHKKRESKNYFWKYKNSTVILKSPPHFSNVIMIWPQKRLLQYINLVLAMNSIMKNYLHFFVLGRKLKQMNLLIENNIFLSFYSLKKEEGKKKYSRKFVEIWVAKSKLFALKISQFGIIWESKLLVLTLFKKENWLKGIITRKIAAGFFFFRFFTC